MSDESPAGVPTCYRHTGREAHIRCQRCGRTICPDCMLPASVGFQCPSCVKEGERSTRSGRTPYGGSRSRDPRLTSIALIVLNAAVFFAIQLTGRTSSRLWDLLPLVGSGRCDSISQSGSFYPAATETTCRTIPDGSWVSGVADGAYWQLFTSVFTHLDPWHIAVNMLTLWFLGPQVEAVTGRLRFLGLYLLSGLAGSVAVLWLSDPSTPTMGASGALFGVMGALLLLAIKVGGNYQQILMWLGINAVITVVGMSFISWQGHLGGFLGGAALAAILFWAPRERRGVVQLAGFAAVGLVLVALILIRIPMLG